MARVSIEDCQKKVENRFALVIMAVKRTRELLDGDKPFIESSNKEVVVALREIAQGHIVSNYNDKKFD
jgi:DNA-directed RNA polymerase subunit omega